MYIITYNSTIEDDNLNTIIDGINSKCTVVPGTLDNAKDRIQVLEQYRLDSNRDSKITSVILRRP